MAAPRKKKAKPAAAPKRSPATRKRTPETAAKGRTKAAGATKPAPARAKAVGSAAKTRPPKKDAATGGDNRSAKTAAPRVVERKPPTFDPEWLTSVHDALRRRREELLSVVHSTQAQFARREGDLPDVSDRASEGFEDELTAGLIAIEAAQLGDIEAAIRRIEGGTYGQCADCQKAIPRKRLEILPFARRCLACEGASERRFHVPDEAEEEENSD